MRAFGIFEIVTIIFTEIEHYRFALTYGPRSVANRILQITESHLYLYFYPLFSGADFDVCTLRNSCVDTDLKKKKFSQFLSATSPPDTWSSSICLCVCTRKKKPFLTVESFESSVVTQRVFSKGQHRRMGKQKCGAVSADRDDVSHDKTPVWD